ncbi:MAG: regulatory protein RecX [Melioribacteraceae bacterium]|nr:MAG: regulatory protein RecX [Melioribacteraceae bacterium]
MVVVSITKKGNNVLVLFDDDSNILLNYNVFIDSMLRRNDEVDQNFIEKLSTKNELYKIKHSALNFLGRRSHSKRELYQKITKKGFDKILCNKVLDELNEINLINDIEFAEKYAEEKIKRGKSGINKIKSELIKKGINKNIIEKIELKHKTSDEILDNIFSIASRKLELLKKKETDKRNLKIKLYTHLLGKGFTSEQVSEVLNKIGL